MARRDAEGVLIETPRMDLVLIQEPAMDALLRGDVDKAARSLGCGVPEDMPDPDLRDLLTYRLRQVREQPDAGRWLVRALVLRSDDRPMVGHAGFHGPPQEGRVEIGYTIFEPYRGRGLAVEAATALLGWAHRAQGIDRFRASARPDNLVSLHIIEKLGFVRTGEQMDEIDGLEWVFELDGLPTLQERGDKASMGSS
jgi:RimJ/RimL family protein N-acetyltransferase